MTSKEEKLVQKLQEEIQFKETLLSISEAVASIKGREALLKVVFEKIKPIFNFYDVGLFVIDKNGSASDLAAINPNISPSEVNHKLFTQGINTFEYKKSAIEWVVNIVENNKQPYILHYNEELYNTWPDYYQTDIMKEVGYEESMITTLSVGGDLIGAFFVNSLQKNNFQITQFPLFQAIADQLAVAVSNVIANEELLKEKQFTERLLGISETLVKVSEKEQLFHVIRDEISKLLPMDDLAVVIVNDDKSLWKDISIERSFATQPLANSLYQDGFNAWQPINSLIIEMLESTQITTLEDYREYEDFPEAFLALLEQDGLREFIHTPLRLADQPFGFLVFDAKEHGTYSEQDFPLFQAIADQLAVAVSNVLANEQLLEEKQFKETLLSISEAVASTQTGSQLIRVILDHIQPIFNFYDIGLFVFDNQKNHLNDWVVKYPILSDSKGSQQMFENPTKYSQIEINTDGLVYELMTKLRNDGSPLIVNLSELADSHPDFMQNDIIKEGGYQDTMTTLLRYSGEILGLFCLNSREKKIYHKEQFPLFQAIADQLAVAVNNVLANEQLVEEKQKTEDLLAITESIANITTGPELVSAIFDKLQKVLPFDEAGLFHLDWENEKERDLIIDYGYFVSETGKSINQSGITGWLPMTELSKSIARKTVLLSTEKLYQKYRHPHFKYTKKVPFQQIIAGPLKQGKQAIGLFYFWSKVPNAFDDKLTLFNAMSDQLSVALNNILANEAIQLDNKHKKVSLDIAKSIGTINKIDVLLKETVKTLVPIFKSQEHALIIIDEEQDEYVDLAVMRQEIAGNALDLKLSEKGFYSRVKIPYKGSQLEEVVLSIKQNNDIPVLFDYNKDYSQYKDKKLLEELRKKLDTCATALLKVSGKIIGVFILAYTEGNKFDISQIELFKSLSDQLALAVSNVLAREDIQRREQEKSLQVSLVNTLNFDIPWKDKLLQLTQSFSNYLDNHLVIFAFQPERSTEFCHTFEKIGANEYRHFDYQKFLDFIELDEEEYRNKKEKTDSTLLQTGRDFVKHQQKNTILNKVAKKFNVNSRVTTPLELTFPGHYRLSFLSKNDLGYTEKDKQLLEVIRPSLELALEKVFALERITELNAQLRQEKNYLREEIKLDHDFENIIGQHISLKNAFEQVRQLAPMDISVLITGETGTGKELIARALHETSVRSEKTLIKMNCAAMPSELIESELFGHEKGAFTGATKQRIGKFELAQESTIFLDEVGELSLEAQAKLLRVLQEKEFERLGGSKTLTSDFRVVAATNRNLQEAIDEGTFRSDLFYRLNGFQIYLPPLRDRLEDAPLLARHFAKTFAHKIGKPFTGFTPQSLLQIQEYSWPGNVRELKNRVEQALVTAKTDIVTLQFSDESPLPHPVISNKSISSEGLTIDYIEERKNLLEKELLTQVLEQASWRVSGQKGAAKLLGLKATTLEYRMKKLHISKPS